MMRIAGPARAHTLPTLAAACFLAGCGEQEVLRPAPIAAPALVYDPHSTFPAGRFRIQSTDLTAFARMTVGDLAQRLQSAHGMIVVVVEDPRAHAVRDPVLRRLRSETSRDAQRYYGDLMAEQRRQDAVVENGEFLVARFLAPFENPGATLGNRPYYGQPVIVLLEGAARFQLMHEYCHALLAKSHDAPLVRDGVQVSALTQLRRDGYALQQQLPATMDAIMNSPAHAACALQLCDLSWRSLEHDPVLEELYITSFMDVHADALGLSPAERAKNIRYFDSSLALLAQMIAAGERHPVFQQAAVLAATAGTTREAGTANAIGESRRRLRELFGRYDEWRSVRGR